MQEQEEKKCVLHVDSNVDLNEKVIVFTNESLQICHEKKLIRDQRKKKKSKYDKIILPSIIDNVSGYHARCYKYFCCISEVKDKQLETFPNLPISNLNTSSNVTETCTTNAGSESTSNYRRRSYSRPQRNRKRRISIESHESDENEEKSDDDDVNIDEGGQPSKRSKCRKKTAESNSKELEELEEYAKKINQHFEEVDSFEMIVE